MITRVLTYFSDRYEEPNPQEVAYATALGAISAASLSVFSTSFKDFRFYAAYRTFDKAAAAYDCALAEYELVDLDNHSFALMQLRLAETNLQFAQKELERHLSKNSDSALYARPVIWSQGVREVLQAKFLDVVQNGVVVSLSSIFNHLFVGAITGNVIGQLAPYV